MGAQSRAEQDRERWRMDPEGQMENHNFTYPDSSLDGILARAAAGPFRGNVEEKLDIRYHGRSWAHLGQYLMPSGKSLGEFCILPYTKLGYKIVNCCCAL